MQKYIPLIAGVVVIIGAAVVVRPIMTRQTGSSPVDTAVPSDTSQVTITPSKVETTKDSLVLSSGITLSVSLPVNNSTVSNSSLTVKGKTVAGAEVFINDTETKADTVGNFSATITLEEGDNYILVVANDAAGNYSEKELSVTYTP